MLRRIVFVLLTLAFFSGPVSAQYFERSGYSGIGIPFFESDIYRSFDEDLQKVRVSVTAMLLNDDITFVKSDTGGYDAEFEWIIAVYNDKERVVFSRTVNKKVNVHDYEQTNSRTEKISLKEDFSLEPGEYSVLLRTLDLISNKTAQRKIKMKLPEYAGKKLSISGIMFLHDFVQDSIGNMMDFEPTFSNNFSLRRGEFFIYFDLYAEDVNVPARIRYILETDKETEIDTVVHALITEKVSPHVIKFEKNRFQKNRYELKIEVESSGAVVKDGTNFSFFWSQVPTTTEDIDEALRQMTYILNSDSLDKYEDASLEEKQRFFKSFWAKRDPNPATRKNELMDEYFKRVNYANRQFSTFNMKGWLSDRGRLLIKFGTPDDIERHPFEIDTVPYEIWRYYSLRKEFLFQDYSGFGDYRLHPAYLNVEYE